MMQSTLRKPFCGQPSNGNRVYCSIHGSMTTSRTATSQQTVLTMNLPLRQVATRLDHCNIRAPCSNKHLLPITYHRPSTMFEHLHFHQPRTTTSTFTTKTMSTTTYNETDTIRTTSTNHNPFDMTPTHTIHQPSNQLLTTTHQPSRYYNHFQYHDFPNKYHCQYFYYVLTSSFRLR